MMERLHGKLASKEGKRGYGECEIVLILEQNIVARFVCMYVMYVTLYLTTLASVNCIAGFHEGRHTNTKCYIK